VLLWTLSSFFFCWTSVVGSPITDDSTTNYLPHIAGCMPSKWHATSYDHIGNHWQILSPANWEGCFEFSPKGPPSSLLSIPLPLLLYCCYCGTLLGTPWVWFQVMKVLVATFTFGNSLGQSGVRLPWTSKVLGQKGHSLDVLQLQSSLNSSYSSKGCHNNLLSDSSNGLSGPKRT
jgi:hypothetical protein